MTDGAGNVILEREVTQDDLDNGIFVEVSPHGDRVDVTAQVTDLRVISLQKPAIAHWWI
ncbi:hypothetical protein JCM19237_3099 [Photobacterium aphoticum]|uniref:Uncharacterized protein n=1 Tax=Photobacterium aphoticum TaxID=754436 RepID=A0A090R0S8_9GAMM|nr:hypothetical protein JCM19237_3099 [Photobacterium aphoticum]